MTKVSCIIHIRDGQIANKSAVKKLFDALQDGRYLVDVSAHNKRSNPQNRYYWSLVIPLIKKGIEDMGTELSSDETHEFLKARFNYTELVNESTGEMAQVPRSTAGLTKLQFSEYVEKIQRFAAEFLNTIIPDPGEQIEMSYE